MVSGDYSDGREILCSSAVNDDPIRCLTIMDEQFQKWFVTSTPQMDRNLLSRQKTMFNSYQSQAALFNRLKNEMIGLYAKVSRVSLSPRSSPLPS